MTYLSAFQKGNIVLPSALLFHFHEIFSSSDDFLVWQFFYLQNTTATDDLEPTKIAESIPSVDYAQRAMYKASSIVPTVSVGQDVQSLVEALEEAFNQ